MNTVFEAMKEKMNKTIMALEKEFAGMRAGRATQQFLIKSQLTTMVFQHQFSRWLQFQ